MGLIEKLTQFSGESRVPALRETGKSGATESQSSSNLPDHSSKTAGKQRHYGKVGNLNREPESSGIPPLKKPKLPAGRSAILILCTRNRRPYWHVFKRTPSTDLGWEWERHLPAVPMRPGESTPAVTTDHAKASYGEESLNIGGRYWEDWYCPGCNQLQQRVQNGFFHLQSCSCGANVCAGPGRDQDRNPICPNCGTEHTFSGRVAGTSISGVHAVEKPPGGRQPLSGPERKQIG